MTKTEFAALTDDQQQEYLDDVLSMHFELYELRQELIRQDLVI